MDHSSLQLFEITKFFLTFEFFTVLDKVIICDIICKDSFNHFDGFLFLLQLFDPFFLAVPSPFQVFSP